MSNYPDDVRQYDSDPRSPFYKEPPGEDEEEEEVSDKEDFDEAAAQEAYYHAKYGD